MSPKLSAKGIGVPRLQELGFLEQALRVTAGGGTYDQVRRHLLNWMEARREGPASSGRYMGVRRKPGVGGRQETRFMDNTTESLSELMRLGLLERSPLPTTAGALGAHRSRRYAITETGSQWLDQLTSDPRAASDWLLAEMWEIHPQLAGYYSVLAERAIIIPTLSWTELFPDGIESFGPSEREQYLTELTRRVADAMVETELGWEASAEEIRKGAEAVAAKRTASAVRRRRPYPYTRPQDFTRDCHKGLVGLAFDRAGVRLDFITHEILRRWGRELGIANFSHNVPRPPRGLRSWATAELERPQDGTLVIARRRAAEYGARVLELLPAAYHQTKRQRGGGGFVPVYEVRQDVCWQLRLNGAVFDRAVRDFLSGAGRDDAPYRITLDRAYAGTVPPTEDPLIVTDRHRRRQEYGLLMLSDERSPS